MDKFFPCFDVETKEIIFPEYNMYKFVDGKIVYIIDDD